MWGYFMRGHLLIQKVLMQKEQPAFLISATHPMVAGRAVATESEGAQKVLRNTYLLLAMTLMVSFMTAVLAMSLNIGFLSPLLTIGVYFSLLFATTKTQNSGWGLVWIFALTGWLGFTLGPVINFYMATTAGSQLVLFALSGTATIFFGLSAIALITRKEFDFLTQFIMVGVLVGFMAAIANSFLHLSGVQLAISCMFLLLSSAMILWQTSAIIYGGETNYISATIGLYVALYNLLLVLLSLLGFMDD